MGKQDRKIKEIAEEIDVFDDMLTSLVELLEEKGILTHKEWETRIKEKIEKKKNLQSYREIQFGEEETQEMDIEEQKKRINNLLIEKYGLHIGDWASLDELLDSGYTYSENLELVKDHLKHLTDEHPQEFVDRIGSKALERLRIEFLQKSNIE